MRRIKLTLEYDGNGFYGFQYQARGERTVQQCLEQALENLPGAVPKVTAAGRTDTGVHALGMVVHLDAGDPVPTSRFAQALNQKLPQDLRVLLAEGVSENFHARFDCLWRRYRYRILNRRTSPVLERYRVGWIPSPLRTELMREALHHFLGKHDFMAFATREVRPTTHELYHVDLLKRGEEIWLEFVGSGFARGMVRAMVGTLIEVGLGKRAPDTMPGLLKAADRKKAGPSAPPQGLYFMEAGYARWDQEY